MIRPTDPSTLAQAADDLRSVAHRLDQRQTACDCCGLNKAANWPEAQAARELLALAEKADKLAARLATLYDSPDPDGFVSRRRAPAR